MGRWVLLGLPWFISGTKSNIKPLWETPPLSLFQKLLLREEEAKGESQLKAVMVNLERAWSEIELGLNPGWTITGYKTQASGFTSLCLSFILQYMKRE